MVRARSFSVILLVMLFVTVVTTYLETQVLEELPAETKEAVQQMITEKQEEDPVNLGMSVSVSVEPGEKISVYDMFYANTTAKALALFLVIFTVIFSTADINSGYIKNIGGQVKHRGKLIFSRAFSLLLYTVLFLVLYLLFQAISNRIFLGYLEWGGGKDFLWYTGISVLLSFALEMICMAIAILMRNNVFSMIIAICLCMNVMVIIYNAIDHLIAKTGGKDFQLLEYTITGKFALFPMNPTGRECAGAILTALLYSVFAILLSSVVFEKRDI